MSKGLRLLFHGWITLLAVFFLFQSDLRADVVVEKARPQEESAALGQADRTAVPAAESRPHRCRIQGVSEEVLCATYPVWEDRERKSGRKLGLNIVILPATGGHRAPDPIFIFAGGPGQGATETAPRFSRIGPRNRDIVLVDQRGTGRSNPLDCDLFGNPPDLRKVVGGSFPLDSVRACRERLEKVADLRLYTTAAGMDDVDEVRNWLGYKKVNLWGGSYGSEAAQVYLRRHGSSVRTAVLEGVNPVDSLNPLGTARAGQRAVDILFEKCRADVECNAAFPDLRSEFNSVLGRVAKGIEVQVHDRQGRLIKLRPRVSFLAEGIRHSLYVDSGASFPEMIHRAAGGDFTQLIETAIAAEIRINSLISIGMLLSVTCAEGVPFIDDASLARETRGTFLGSLRVEEQRTACREWVRGPVPSDVHTLVPSDVPVLLLSGGRDPATPPAYAERVARLLSRSRHVVFPEASHINWGPCGYRIAAEFIERGSADGLDVSCAAQQSPPRFVIRPPVSPATMRGRR